MANEKETVILDFQVEQASAISELEKTKKSIVQLKQEQQALNKAYKDGVITIEEYASESVRVESILKKQVSTYNTVQKSVTGVKTSFDKLIEGNSNLLKILDKVNPGTQQLAVNIGTVQKSFTSTLGAIDKYGFSLKALNNIPILSLFSALQSSIQYLDELYKSTLPTVEDYKFENKEITKEYERQKSALDSLEPSLKRQVDILKEIGGQEQRINEIRRESLLDRIATEDKRLKDLQQQEKDAKQNLDTLLKDQQGYVSRYGAASGAITDKIKIANEANKQVNESLLTQVNLVEDLKTEYEILNIQAGENAIRSSLDRYNTESALQAKIRDLRIKNLKEGEVREIASIRERSRNEIDQLKGSESQVLEQRILIESNAQSEIEKVIDKYRRERIRKDLKMISDLQKSKAPKSSGDIILSYYEEIRKGAEKEEKEFSDLNKKLFAHLDASAKKFQETEQKKTRDAIAERKIRDAQAEAELQTAQYVSDALVSLASIGGEQTELYKAAAIAQTVISTYSSATKSYDALSSIPIVGPALGAAAAAAAIASGLANVAQISGIAAAGGADFVTNKPTMLLVGDNPGGRERVTVEPLSGRGKTRTFGNGRGVAMAGGGSLTIDGGAMMNEATAGINQSVMMANLFKNMPAPEVSVKEINKVQKRVQVKENVSRIGGRA